MTKTPNRTGAGLILMIIFAISGFAGLIYESIWTQYLGLFLGHAAYAQSFVLMLFMGGMALGAWLVSRRSERLARPLAAYAAVEFVVGVLGIAFDPLYHATTGFAYAHLFPIVGSGMTLDVVRYAISTLTIGVQCVLLGMTFPLMSAGYLRLAPAAGGRVLASLYFSNSFGAALGALTATFVLLPIVGLPGTVMTGGLLSILVAIAIWPLARVPVAAQPAAAPTRVREIAPALILLAAAITGATSFVYEITWVRMLSQALGSTLHAFELMLAAFISGIAFGGLWLRRHADRLQSALFGAGWAQVLMGIAALGSLFVYMHAFDWVATLRTGLARSEQAYTLFNVATGLISLAVMFPAAFFAGMTLPLLTLALLRDKVGEQAIGRTYAANTLGAIAGVLLTMHVLMPLLGVRLALWLAALADLVLGLYLLQRGRDASVPNSKRHLAGAALASVAVAAAALALTRMDPLVLASSVYRVDSARLPKGTEMIFYGDGKTATVALYKSSAKGDKRSIATNGKIDASISMDADLPPTPDEYTMVLAAVLPLAMSEAPKNVGVIGFGSGLTAHTFLGSARVERMDVIEIEPFMVKAAKNFGSHVERAYTDPRAHIIIDDAKAYMSGTPTRYDAIVSEPSNPWVSGVAALFSEEFYDFVPQHLAENGIFVQWLQLYEIKPELVASVMKAMLPRFADVNAYMSNEGDLLLVASAKGRLPPLGDIAEREPGLRAELKRLSVDSTADLRRFFLMDKRGLEALTAMSGRPANSDLFPLLQLEAPKTRFMNTNAVEISKLQLAPWPLLEAVAGYRPNLVSEPMSAVEAHVARDAPQRGARSYRAALLSGGPVAREPAELALRFDLMRSGARTCEIGDVGSWIVASTTVAAATIPYLRAEDLEGVWIHPTWVGACSMKDVRVAQVLAFHAAVAARDWPSVAQLGKAMLADKAFEDIPEFRTFALGATELAHVVLNDFDGLTAIDDAYGSNARRYSFELQWMKAMAYLSKNSRAAQGQP